MWGNEYEEVKRARRRRTLIWLVVLAVVAVIAGPFLYNHYGTPSQDRQLANAVRSGELGVAQEALSRGADPNRVLRSGRSLLHEAAWRGHRSIARELLQSRADVNARDRNSGETPLHTAVRANNEEMVRLLLAAGARTSLRNLERGEPCVNGQTPGANLTAAELAEACDFPEVARRLRGE